MQLIKSNSLKTKNNIYPKVLFYTGIARAFQTTLIGYLYEISQVYPVVLLSEKLNSKTSEIIKNKKLFPKLEKIIEIRQHTEKKMNLINLLARQRYFPRIAKDLIQDYKPNVVFATGSDIFESYLRRFAKNINAITIAGTGPLFIQPEELRAFRSWGNTYERLPAFLPKSIKMLYAEWRKYLTHFLYYWIFPLLAGQKPFTKEQSSILWDIENVKGADYYFVFSKLDYDILVNNNAPAEKLFILAHPLRGRGRKIFEKINFFNAKNAKNRDKNNAKLLTVMWPKTQVEFERKNFTLISKEEVQKNRIRIVNLIAKVLEGWKIFIKPHPMVKNNPRQFQEIVKSLESISSQIEVVDPLDPAEEYIEMSDAIIGLPPASTTIFSAPLQCPQKPILSLDLYQESSGNLYKNFNEVEYIDNEEKLINILELIRDNKYRKKAKPELKPEGFLSIVDALKWIFNTNGYS